MAAGESSHLIRFLYSNRYLVGSREAPGQVLTHTLMDGQKGGKVCLPSSASDDFFAAYGRDLAAGTKLFVVERRSPIFKMHFDLDVDVDLTDVQLEELVDVLHQAAGQYFPSLAPVRCIACTSMRGDARVASSLHVVFPFLGVNEEQALWVRAGVVARCTEELPHLALDFGKVVDICVLTSNGLRMVGSDKCRCCPVCRNAADAKPFCDRCSRQGRVVEGKIYMPWKVWPKAEAEALAMQEHLRANLAYAAKVCSIRLPEACSPSEAFRVPVGAPPAHVRKRVGSVAFSEGQAVLPPSFSKLRAIDLESALWQRLKEELRRFHVAYKRLDLKEVRLARHRRGLTFLLKVSGFGCRYCLNKGGDHTSQCIYFVITQHHGLQQRCYSRKPEPRLHGLCEAFSSEPKELAEDLMRSLFEGDSLEPAAPPKLQRLALDADKPPCLPSDEVLVAAMMRRNRAAQLHLAI
jgi:hypothetical protein